MKSSGWDLTEALKSVCVTIGVEALKSQGSISTEEELTELAEKLRYRAKEEIRDQERVWALNLANTLGHQNITVDVIGRAVAKLKAPTWRVRHIVNMIAPALQRKLAKLTQLKPNPEVTPKSTDYEHVRSAELAGKVLEAKCQEAKFQRAVKLWLLSADIFSRSYMKTWWNPKLGENVYVDGDKKYYDGDIDYDIEDPRTLFYDPSAKCIDEAQWAVSCQVRPKSWVVKNYPKIADKIIQGTVGHTPDTMWGWLMSKFRHGKQDADNNEYVSVVEFWQAPDKSADDKWAKKGFFFVVVEKYLAKPPTEYPYECGKLPWVEMTDAYMQGLSKHGPTYVAQLLPMQHMYNDTLSMMKENLAMYARPKWIAPRGCNLDNDAITSEPGEVITCDPDGNGNMPTPVSPKDPNPGSYESICGMTKLDFDNVSGQHDVTRGIAPGANTTGYAIDLLQQADNTVTRPQADEYRIALTQVMKLMLDLYRQYSSDDERSLVLYKRVGNYVTFSFKGSNLEYRDIHIEPNSMKPTNPLANREQIFKFLEGGLFGPYESPEHEAMAKKVIRAMEWGDLTPIFNEASADTERAEWENSILDEVRDMVEEPDPRTGEVKQVPVLPDEFIDLVQPNPFDDDDTHIKTHEQRQKNLSFNKLPLAARLAHMEHTEGHKIAKRVKNAEAQQMDAELVQSGLLLPTNPQQAAMGMPDLNAQIAQAEGAGAVQAAAPPPPTEQGMPPMPMPPAGVEGPQSAPIQPGMI